jgi:hypothetical protein
MEEKRSVIEGSKDKKDANTCMALGVGVGALGAASAALSGAVCPLCIFIAPGLVGFGAYKRWRASQMESKLGANEKNSLRIWPSQKVTS